MRRIKKNSQRKGKRNRKYRTGDTKKRGGKLPDGQKVKLNGVLRAGILPGIPVLSAGPGLEGHPGISVGIMSIYARFRTYYGSYTYIYTLLEIQSTGDSFL